MSAALVVPPLPEGRTFALRNRGEIFARVAWGSGTPVVLVHGWMATADLNWFSAFPALAGAPLVAPDLRGHGRGILPHGAPTLEDCADDIAALLREVGMDGGAVVAGYSLGVAVSLLVAQRHPELVRGLVLSAGALHWRGAFRHVMIRRAGWDGSLQRFTDGRFLARKMADRAERANPAVAAWRDWMCAEFERGHPGALRSMGKGLARFDSRPWAGKLDVPTEVIVTTNDHLVSAKRQRALAAEVGARVTEIDADHDAPVRSAQVFVPAITAAIERLRDGLVTDAGAAVA